MCQLKEGVIFPTSFYTADIFNDYQNQKYKNFLIDLSKKTDGEKRSIVMDGRVILYCGKKMFLNHF